MMSLVASSVGNVDSKSFRKVLFSLISQFKRAFSASSAFIWNGIEAFQRKIDNRAGNEDGK
ncbi:unnamed protein product [Haemonchus placei]|uniref:Uncharacterized protein n=1 Tax=Haemonchus placei TaxID=6290 RepID=A0A3P7XN90_HAEPC|nr:unnamed protein product [Haemonchus placei]